MKIEELKEYEIIKHEPLPDIHADGWLLRHRKSGARVVLIPCGDTNKVFNIAFRTTPKDSTGVPHIIEHTVLCGSKKYPLKDPFVELVKGSLNTFLNAITYPDKTMFPVASTNDQDFRNLMNVYLDAVFYPNIYREKNIFRQEGWHYEIEKPEDPIRLNGVVYNEMKGAYSSAETVLERETMRALYPDTTYGVESGGEPEHIPDLTYEQYLDFHRTYYHPSNSYIYLYGDMDMAETLTFIDREYLSSFDRQDVDSAIRTEKPSGKIVTVKKPYPVSDEEPLEHNTYLTWNVTAGNPLDIRESIAFNVLDYALLSMPGAPVRQALLDAGIGRDVYGEYDDGIAQPYFSITAKNADPEDADRFREIIKKTLTEQAEHGIDPKSIRAGLNYLEFQFREADYSSYPKGLMYSIDVLGTWLYDDDAPFNALKPLRAYEELRSDAEHGYFEKLVKEKLLTNPSGAVVVLTPEHGLTEKRERETERKLAEFKAGLTDAQIAELIRETKALKAWQEAPESPEALKTLPVLKRSDIRKEALQLKNDVHLEDADGQKVKVVYHDEPSNGILYADFLWDLRYVPEQLLPYVGILKAVLANVDTEEHGFADLNNEINAETGGILTGITMADDPENPEGYQAFFGVRVKALYSKFPKASALIREIITETKFDDAKRIGEIISQIRSQAEISIQTSGHAAAAGRALAYITSAGAFSELVSGISFFRFIQDIEAHYDEKAEEVRTALESLMGILFRPDRLLVSASCEPEGRAILRASLADVAAANAYPANATLPEPYIASPLGRLNEGFTTPGQVQYVAMAGDFRRAGHTYTGAMQIYKTIMSYAYLWQNIRVQGGAYGCSAGLRRDGIGTFTSYRDPNLARTKEVYLGIPDYLAHFRADEDEMTKYIIGTMSGIDTPLTPFMDGSYSMRAYLSGVTQEDTQKSRDEILGATDADIRALAPVVRDILAQDNFTVVGGETAVKRDASLFDHIERLL